MVVYHSAFVLGSVQVVEYAELKFLRTFSTAVMNLFTKMGFSRF